MGHKFFGKQENLQTLRVVAETTIPAIGRVSGEPQIQARFCHRGKEI